VLLEAYGRTEIGDAEAAAACRFAPLSLSAANAATLGRRGLVVIDGVLSQRQLAAARRDASGLRAGRFALAGDHGERGDAVSWVRGDDADVGDGLRHAVRMLRGVADELERHGYVASTTHRVPRQCQLARYGPSGKGYDRHLDRCALGVEDLGLLEWLRLSDYRGRALTAIIYLNEDWSLARDGGALRCWIAGRDVFDVAPTGGRLVIFDSGVVEHAVLAACADRMALTVWISGERRVLTGPG